MRCVCVLYLGATSSELQPTHTHTMRGVQLRAKTCVGLCAHCSGDRQSCHSRRLYLVARLGLNNAAATRRRASTTNDVYQGAKWPLCLRVCVCARDINTHYFEPSIHLALQASENSAAAKNAREQRAASRSRT